jgi:hypothetical protein
MHRTNRILILVGWVLVVTMTAGMIVCTILWLTDRISDRAMVGLGMLLGWASMVGLGADFL